MESAPSRPTVRPSEPHLFSSQLGVLADKGLVNLKGTADLPESDGPDDLGQHVPSAPQPQNQVES